MPDLLAGLDFSNPRAVFDALIRRYKETGSTIHSIMERLAEGAVITVGGMARQLAWDVAETKVGEKDCRVRKYYFARQEWGVGHAGAVVLSDGIALIPPRKYNDAGRLQVLAGIAEVYDPSGQVVTVLTVGTPPREIAKGSILFVRLSGLLISLAEGGIQTAEVAAGVYPPPGWDDHCRWAPVVLPPRSAA